jgi:transposase
VDAAGVPKQIELTAGNTHDSQCAEALIEHAEAGAIIADKAYDADTIVAAIEDRGMLAVIPSKSNRLQPRDLHRELYRERNVVERFFARLKHYRGLATRYEKTAVSYLAMLYLVCVKSWLI